MITYRNATLDDLPFIVDVYNSTIASKMVTADTSVVSIESKLDWFNQHNRKNRPLWLIQYQNQNCGWISLSSFYGRPAFNNTVEISLYLHSDFRGKHIGHYMIQEIENFAISIEIKAVLSFVFRHNQPSLRLFEKLNYTQWGLLPKIAQFDDLQCDLVILGKHLNR